MQVTTIIPLIRGMFDSDLQPVVVEGHLTLEQAKNFSENYGNEYSYCHCSADESGAAWRAVFSNEENPEFDNFGEMLYESRGDLELVFFVGGTKPKPS